MDNAAPLPLDGITVLDFSQGEFGPYCAMMLADMGADVIKIERPDIGEGWRFGGINSIAAGVSNMFAAINRGKRSLAVDITSDEGRDVVYRLVREADVVLHNMRPGVMERIGFGYEQLSELNPRIVMCSESAYGETGPHAQRAGQDLLTQAFSGIIALQGYEGDAPRAVGTPIADGVGAITAAWGIVLALFVRERTGVGQEITTNLFDALLALSPMDFCDYLMTGNVEKGGRGWYPQMPYGPWQARDRAVVVNLQGDMAWPKFCQVMGIDDAVRDDPRFATNMARRANRKALEAVLDPAFASKDAAYWQGAFEAEGLRCDPVYDYRDVEADPQTTVNQMIVEQEHPEYGKLRTVGMAIKLKKTPGRPGGPRELAAPTLGEHTRVILEDLGYDDGEIADFERRGLINTRGAVAIQEAMAKMLQQRSANPRAL
ncbi:MAG: CoA transferase [Dehalococcoidia bacterium]|nr:CoA transferase [Dehalococcoidia bacterium]